MDIKWHIIDERFDLVMKKPELLLNPVREEYDGFKVKKCPGINDMWSNTFVIRSPFDFTISYDKELQRVLIDEEKTSINVVEFSNIISNDIRLYTKFPVVQILLQQVYSSNKQCKMSLIPPIFHLHDNDAWKHIRFSSGVIDIHNWHRSVNWGFEWLDTSKKITFKKDEPLCYVIFNSTKLNDTFNIKPAEFSGEIKKSYVRCVGGRHILPTNTIELINQNKIFTSDSQCPFSKTVSKLRFWKR
jgi:hypothetical protein